MSHHGRIIIAVITKRTISCHSRLLKHYQWLFGFLKSRGLSSACSNRRDKKITALIQRHFNNNIQISWRFFFLTRERTSSHIRPKLIKHWKLKTGIQALALGGEKSAILAGRLQCSTFDSAHVSAIGSDFSFNIIWRLHFQIQAGSPETSRASAIKLRLTLREFSVELLCLSVVIFFKCVFWKQTLHCEWLLLRLQVYCTVFRYNIAHSG